MPSSASRGTAAAWSLREQSRFEPSGPAAYVKLAAEGAAGLATSILLNI